MELHFESAGHGPPLLILHGLYGSLENWRSMTRHLSEVFQVFAIDLRNHGRSPHSSEMTYPSMAGDVREFMRAQQLERAHILGHSMGGKVAMQFALLHAEQVERLIVADMAPKAYPTKEKGIVEALLALDPSKFENRKEMEEILAGPIPDLAARRFLLKDLKRDGNGRFHWQMNLRAIRDNYEILTREVTGTPFQKPTLFLRGEKSRYIKPEDTALIKTLFPNAIVQALEGAGHWLHVETPEAFFRNVRDFLLPAKSSG
jgi:pimeloyl-ACP methyl ester carboxylesterase